VELIYTFDTLAFLKKQKGGLFFQFRKNPELFFNIHNILSTVKGG